MKKLFLVLFIAVFSYAEGILVAAAANTTYAMPEIIKEFNKKYPGIKVDLVLASSGKLTAQIMHGAPYDVFMSANMKYPDFLFQRGFSKTEPAVYAKGALSLLSVKKEKLKDLNSSVLSARLIAVANPKSAPYGKAAVEAMKKAGVYSKVKDRLVYAESVAGVIPYVLREADVGVVAKSSLYSEKMKRYTNHIDVPVNLYSPINQGIILLHNSKEAKLFYDFILSDKAEEIFKKYGYIY